MYGCQNFISNRQIVKATVERLFRNAAKQGKSVTVRYGSSHGHAPAIRPVTINELPVPSGSWAAYNSRLQRKYNLHLLAGIAFTSFTLFSGYEMGIFYLNPGPDRTKVKPEAMTYAQAAAIAAAAAESKAAAEAEPVVEDVAEPVVEAEAAVEPVVEAEAVVVIAEPAAEPETVVPVSEPVVVAVVEPAVEAEASSETLVAEPVVAVVEAVVEAVEPKSEEKSEQ